MCSNLIALLHGKVFLSGAAHHDRVFYKWSESAWWECLSSGLGQLIERRIRSVSNVLFIQSMIHHSPESMHKRLLASEFADGLGGELKVESANIRTCWETVR